MKTRKTPTFADRASNTAIRVVFAGARLLPYPQRVAAMGWIVARIAAPIAGWDKRVRDNLAYVWPDLPEAQVRRMMRDVPDNFGRSLAETYAGPIFAARVGDSPLTGPGVEALAEAHRAKRPVLLITGHFGNYDAMRAALLARGYPVGALYNPMSNPLFNAHYVEAMEGIGKPMFERGRKGLAEMVRFLRGGGMVGVVADHFIMHGTRLEFLGKPAWTALSAAEMGLKYNALVIPTYAVRQPDGLSFRLIVDHPIPHSTPETMTQAMNDSLGALVKDHPEQWFWIHRRWKTPPGYQEG